MSNVQVETPQTPTPASPATVLTNAVKALGEVAVVPGASLIVDGQVKAGVLHAAGGLLSYAILGPFLGPLVWFGFAVDSYSRSVTGKHVYDHLMAKQHTGL